MGALRGIVSTLSCFSIIVSGGMNTIYSYSSNCFSYFEITDHNRCCWFVGTMVGTVLAATIFNAIPKKPLVITCNIIHVLDGVPFLLWYDNEQYIVTARYVDGFVFGLVVVPTLMLAGEESTKYMRGKAAACAEMVAYNIGVYVQIVWCGGVLGELDKRFNVLQAQGMIHVVLGGVFVFISVKYFVETPLYYLERGNERAAVASLRKLRGPTVSDSDIRTQMNDYRIYMKLNDEVDGQYDFIEGVPALLKMCFVRAMIPMNISKIMYAVFTEMAAKATSDQRLEKVILHGFGLSILLGSGLVMSRMHKVKRKIPVIFATSLCGAIALAVAIIKEPEVIVGLLLIYHFFASFYSIFSSAYLSEAFPLYVKPFYVCAVFIVQMSVAVCMIRASFPKYSYYFTTLSILSFAHTILSFIFLPETMHTTLAEAQIEFAYVVNVSF